MEEILQELDPATQVAPDDDELTMLAGVVEESVHEPVVGEVYRIETA